jgi:hypothetical protein
MTSARQPIGLMPRTSPFWVPLARPRPTAGGYSSRSNSGLVAMFSSSRSRRWSAPGRLSTRILGQPLAIAASIWVLMFGYLVALKRSRWTVAGRLQVLLGAIAGG